MLRECRWDDWVTEATCVNFKIFSRVVFKTFAAVILLQNRTSLRGEIPDPNVCWPCKTGTSWYFRALFWFITWPPSCLNMKDSTLVSYKYYDKGQPLWKIVCKIILDASKKTGISYYWDFLASRRNILPRIVEDDWIQFWFSLEITLNKKNNSLINVVKNCPL